MKVHKDKLTFRKSKLNTEISKNMQKEGAYYKKIKTSMEKHGMINPLICIQEGDIYKICLGMKRFIIGCDLGMQEFEIKVVPNDNVKLLKEENAKFKPTDADNAYFKFIQSKQISSN
jgi:hypothetical protein